MKLAGILGTIRKTEQAFRALGQSQDALYVDMGKVTSVGGDITNLVRKHQYGAMLANMTVSELLSLRSRAVAYYELEGTAGLSLEDVNMVKSWVMPQGRVIVGAGGLQPASPDMVKILQDNVNKLSREKCEEWYGKTLVNNGEGKPR